MAKIDKTIVSVHVMVNENIPDPTAVYFSELERLQIDVAMKSRYKTDTILVDALHIDNEDGLVYERRVSWSGRTLSWHTAHLSHYRA